MGIAPWQPARPTHVNMFENQNCVCAHWLKCKIQEMSLVSHWSHTSHPLFLLLLSLVNPNYCLDIKLLELQMEKVIITIFMLLLLSARCDVVIWNIFTVRSTIQFGDSFQSFTLKFEGSDQSFKVRVHAWTVLTVNTFSFLDKIWKKLAVWQLNSFVVFASATPVGADLLRMTRAHYRVEQAFWFSDRFSVSVPKLALSPAVKSQKSDWITHKWEKWN